MYNVSAPQRLTWITYNMNRTKSFTFLYLWRSGFMLLWKSLLKVMVLGGRRYCGLWGTDKRKRVALIQNIENRIKTLKFRGEILSSILGYANLYHVIWTCLLTTLSFLSCQMGQQWHLAGLIRGGNTTQCFLSCPAHRCSTEELRLLLLVLFPMKTRVSSEVAKVLPWKFGSMTSILLLQSSKCPRAIILNGKIHQWKIRICFYLHLWGFWSFGIWTDYPKNSALCSWALLCSSWELGLLL